MVQNEMTSCSKDVERQTDEEKKKIEEKQMGEEMQTDSNWVI